MVGCKRIGVLPHIMMTIKVFQNYGKLSKLTPPDAFIVNQTFVVK